MSDAIGFSAGREKSSFQRLARGIGHRVQQQVHLRRVLANILEKRVNFRVAGDVTGIEWDVFAEGGGEFFDVLLHPFPLVVENQLHTLICPCLRNGPSNATLVSHAKHDPDFSLQRFAIHRRQHSRPRQTTQPLIFSGSDILSQNVRQWRLAGPDFP